MESNDRRRRQSNTPGYSGQPSILQSNTQYPSVTSADRYRQASLAAPISTSGSGPPRSTDPAAYSYGYGGESSQYVGQPMQAGALQYPNDYTSDTHRSSQQYSQYGSTMMYGVQQQQQQQPSQQSAYESVQQSYQPRQSAAIEVLASQFGVPQNISQNYYVAGEAGPTSAPATAMATPSVSTQYSGLSYTSQQSPLNRDTLAPAFVPGMADSVQSSSNTGFARQSYGSQTSSDIDQAYARYQTILKQTFAQISEGRLIEAGSSLLELTQWLLSSVESLGLVRDEQTLHAERLKLWENFNNCWLTALQKQKEASEEMLETGQRLRTPQTLMEPDFLETLGRELVHFCDLMEKHGLVDYQMGVWEEEIIAMLTACLDLIEGQRGPSGSQPPRTSASQRR